MCIRDSKSKVVKFLDVIDDEAKILGNINCISKSDDMICGFNTDKYGFDMLLKKNNIIIDGSSCIILGAGSSAKTVVKCLIDQGIHMIDLMHYLSGGFTDAQAVLSDKFLNIKGVEDNAFVTLYSKKRGFSASIHSTITQWRYLFSLEIFLLFV